MQRDQPALCQYLQRRLRSYHFRCDLDAGSGIRGCQWAGWAVYLPLYLDLILPGAAHVISEYRELVPKGQAGKRYSS